MKSHLEPFKLEPERATELSLRAGSAFTPRTPVSTRELFAGRWPQLTMLADAVSQVGLHVVLFGERGVGKTSLANVIPFTLRYFDEKSGTEGDPRIVVRVNANANDTFESVWRKAFDQITWREDSPRMGFQPTPGTQIVTLREAFGLGDDLSIENVRRTLGVLKDSVFIVDEFDRLSRRQTPPFTDLIKELSDAGVHTTIVIVGVAQTVDELVKDHASIKRALIQIPLPRMTADELRQIIVNAERSLGVVFAESAGERIVTLSQGLPHYTHLIGLLAVRSACRRMSGNVESEDVATGLHEAVRQADHTVAADYTNATHSAQPDALYARILLACALTAARDGDPAGYFQPVSVVESLSVILRRGDPVEISMFNKHLAEFCEGKRASVLERTGRTRAFRYRFRDPLMPPYVLMRGIADGLANANDVDRFLGEQPAQ